MPPYQNDSLHDMHALMQQLDTLNAAHAPDHLEMFNPFNRGDKTAPAPAPTPDDGKGSTSMLSRMTGGMLGGKKTEPSAQDTLFSSLEPHQKVIVFENTFKDVMTILKAPHSNASWERADMEALKTALQSFAKTKTLIEANITPDPKLKT